MDNALGWQYELEFMSGTTGQWTAVEDGADAERTVFFTSREAAGVYDLPDGSTPLRIPVANALGDLTCVVAADPRYAPTCAAVGGGRFRLKSLTVVSWFEAGGAAVANTDAGVDAAAIEAAAKLPVFTKKEVVFGSPRASSPAEWDGEFFVGAWGGMGCGDLGVGAWVQAAITRHAQGCCAAMLLLRCCPFT